MPAEQAIISADTVLDTMNEGLDPDGIDPAFWANNEPLTDAQVQTLTRGWIRAGSAGHSTPSAYTFASLLGIIFRNTNENDISESVTEFLHELSEDELSTFLDDDFTTIQEWVNGPDIVNFMNFLWAFYQDISLDQRGLVDTIIQNILNPANNAQAVTDNTATSTVAIASNSLPGLLFDGMELANDTTTNDSKLC